MRGILYCFVAIALLTACSQEQTEDYAAGNEEGKGEISGPFPKTVQGTIGYSYPLEDGSGKIKLGLLEFEGAAIIVSGETYDAKGMDKDDAEVSLTIEPLTSDQCSNDEPCFTGY